MDQKQAMKLALEGHNLFITGKAGTGKSYTLNKIIKKLKDKGKKVAVTASTGIAATHIDGKTIHSWAGIGIKEKLIIDDLHALRNNPYSFRRIAGMNVLIIDELSMLDNCRLDLVDQVCRFLKEGDKPFGGLQVIVCGDFFQLPPVEKSKNPQIDYCFYAKSWAAADFKVCYLEKIYRQNDTVLIDILNNIRRNKVTSEQIEVLKGLSQNFKHTDDAVNLYCKNVDVDAMNLYELNQLEGDPSFSYMTHDKRAQVFHINGLKKACLAPETLLLKEGAKVMHLINDPRTGLVNGTLAEVTDLSGMHDEVSGGYVEIKTLKTGETISVVRHKWKLTEYNAGGYEKIIAWIEQFPLKLAWALTVHKSQGATFNYVNTDLTDVFVQNMGYVALSRATALKGIYLKGFNEIALEVDPEIIEKDKEFLQESSQNE